VGGGGGGGGGILAEIFTFEKLNRNVMRKHLSRKVTNIVKTRNCIRAAYLINDSQNNE
jgi:hypothetical protein